MLALHPIAQNPRRQITTYSGARPTPHSTTTDLQESSENIGTIRFKVDCTCPLGMSLAGHPIAVIGHLGTSTFAGSNRDALGFTYPNEAGVSLQAGIKRYGLPVSKLSLGAMRLWGDNVKGWSFLFGYES
jgi:hypothetical protein